MASLPFICLFGFLFFPAVFLPPTKADLNSARAVDHLLQTYAFKSFPISGVTGQVYKAVIPANLSGIQADLIRFRSGSLRRRGSTVKEFGFPTGIVVQPHVTRLIIVRQNLGNWSQNYYDYYPTGFRLAAPVVGFLAYDASNLNAFNLSELGVAATGDAITIDFTNFTGSKGDSSALCVFFDLNGTVAIENQTANNVCKSYRQGHFSLLVKTSPSPSPSPSPSSSPSPSANPTEKKKKSGRWRVLVGAIVGVLGAILLAILFLVVLRIRKKRRMADMERRAVEDEAFRTATVGRVRTPVAAVTRTTPTVENDYVPGD